MLSKFRTARFQSSAGLIFGLISWFLPLGVAFALLAIIFGLVGLSRSLGKDKYSTYASLTAITLGSTARLGYAILTNTAVEAAVFIAAAGILTTILIIFRYKTKSH